MILRGCFAVNSYFESNGNCIVLVIRSPLVSRNTAQMIDLITAGMNFPSKSGILMKHFSAV